MSGILGRLRLLRTSSGSIWPAQTCRYLAAERTNHVSVTMDPDFDGSVAIVKLQKKPVNSLCSNHLQEITKTITGLENNERVRAMIITSAFPGVFCAGLDLMSMYQRTDDEIYTFWHHFQDMVLKNYTTPLITIAAINGHCVAGGCTIAFGTDYRVMCEDHLTGLNEARLGLPIPILFEEHDTEFNWQETSREDVSVRYA
ncbi:3,2-trans-enoyl-CoA isomerase, mitochondrial [Apostichopus japonicus]|uniref:3,2-trans-enoyl-CoA isomerase, mitochondrial n=1 Tax=Stichopus japonicus TaxID=307972 RepID=A0A2G8LJE5_STIJA|nr:3,2-trans-enoyl-CoA isomerase, mitochondrial [Apostichopus japonicus]